MQSAISKNLSLQQMVKRLQITLNSQAKDDQFLYKIDHKIIQSQYHLHWLYLIINIKFLEAKDKYNVYILCDNINLVMGLSSFLTFFQNRGMGKFVGVSDGAVGEVLELLKIILMHRRYAQDIREMYTDTARSILQALYTFIRDQSKNPQLLNKFLECLSIMRKNYNCDINQELYSEHLMRAVTKLPQYLEFTISFFRRPGNKQPRIIENLIKGLIPRLNILLSNEAGRDQLTSVLLVLIDFLKTQPHESLWLSTLLKQENQKIFDALLILTTKNENYVELAHIFNSLVEMYMSAKLSNNQKYEFIIKMFKFIIQKSSNFFHFVATLQFAQEKEFIYWFIHSELKIAQAKEIRNAYFSSARALQFLLVMMIYFVCDNEQEGRELLGLMRGINLLEESKEFINCVNIREYLKVFYYYSEASEEYQDFISSIQSRFIPVLL